MRPAVVLSFFTEAGEQVLLLLLLKPGECPIRGIASHHTACILKLAGACPALQDPPWLFVCPSP